MKATGVAGRAWWAPCRPARGRDLYNDVGADRTYYGIIRPVARTIEQITGAALQANVCILWNTVYTARALEETRAEGKKISAADIARLSPLGTARVIRLSRVVLGGRPSTRERDSHVADQGDHTAPAQRAAWPRWVCSGADDGPTQCAGHSSWWRVDGVSGGGGLEEFDLDGQQRRGLPSRDRRCGAGVAGHPLDAGEGVVAATDEPDVVAGLQVAQGLVS